MLTAALMLAAAFVAAPQAGPRLRPLPPPNDLLPDWLPIDEQAGLVGYLLFFGPIAAGVVLLILAGRKVFRQFTTRAS
jgi:hypothetical protein